MAAGSSLAFAGPAQAASPDNFGYLRCDNVDGGDGTAGKPWTSVKSANAGLDPKFNAGTDYQGLRLVAGSADACTGMLNITRSGTGEGDARFVVESFDATLPPDEEPAAVTINGSGDDTVRESALRLVDQSHVLVRNVHFTNTMRDGSVPPAPGAGPGDRRGQNGIRIRAHEKSVTDITFDDVAVSNVNCSTAGVCPPRRSIDQNDDSYLAAISVLALRTHPVDMSGIVLQNSHVTNVGHTGIRVQTDWNAERADMLDEAEVETGPNQNIRWVTGVHVNGNIFDHTTGGVAIFAGTEGAQFLHNDVTAFGTDAQFTSAGVYPHTAKNTDISYNTFQNGGGGAVSSCPANKNGDECQKDGQAVDLDGGAINTTVSHNTSRNNDRGFLMMCRLGPWQKTPHDPIKWDTPLQKITSARVFDNTSTDDRGYGVRMACGGNVQDIVIENNTWEYTKDFKPELITAPGQPDRPEPVHMLSNVDGLVTPDQPTANAVQHPFNWGTQLTFRNNTVSVKAGSPVELSTSVYANRPNSSVYVGTGNQLERNGVPTGLIEPTESARMAAPGVTTTDTIYPASFFSRPVTVTSPTDGAVTEEKRPTFTGTGQPGSTVQVRGASTPVTDPATVGADGTWTAPSVIDIPDGKHQLTIEQTTEDAITSKLQLALVKDTSVQFVSPADGAVVSGPRPIFTGTGSPGAKILVRGTAGNATDTVWVRADGTWVAPAIVDLKPGDYAVTVTQTPYNGNEPTTDNLTFRVRT